MFELGNDKEFTLIGTDEQQTPPDLDDAGPGTVVVMSQRLYRENGYFVPGEQVGWVFGTAVVEHFRWAVCDFTFLLDGTGGQLEMVQEDEGEQRPDDRDRLTVHGAVPIKDRTLGAGTLVVTGGSGNMKGSLHTVYLETRNPKRWSFLP